MFESAGATLYPEDAMSSLVEICVAAVEQYVSYCVAAVNAEIVKDNCVNAVAEVAADRPAGDEPPFPVPEFTSVPVGAVAELARTTQRIFSVRAEVSVMTKDVPAPKLLCAG
tara:strand:+ start:120 stop:455 length:336 start_codon:yes stop_codon:yes gene_type:complete